MTYNVIMADRASKSEKFDISVIAGSSEKAIIEAQRILNSKGKYHYSSLAVFPIGGN
jgi:hypothetical protein